MACDNMDRESVGVKPPEATTWTERARGDRQRWLCCVPPRRGVQSGTGVAAGKRCERSDSAPRPRCDQLGDQQQQPQSEHSRAHELESRGHAIADSSGSDQHDRPTQPARSRIGGAEDSAELRMGRDRPASDTQAHFASAIVCRLRTASTARSPQSIVCLGEATSGSVQRTALLQAIFEQRPQHRPTAMPCSPVANAWREGQHSSVPVFQSGRTRGRFAFALAGALHPLLLQRKPPLPDPTEPEARPPGPPLRFCSRPA